MQNIAFDRLVSIRLKNKDSHLALKAALRRRKLLFLFSWSEGGA